MDSRIIDASDRFNSLAPVSTESEQGLQVFNNSEFGEVRAVLIDGEPWFVAVDVCKALDVGNSRQALTRLDDDEKGVISTDTLGGKQEMSIINEPGLYSLVLGSRKPQAKAFKRWITHEVIPSIRKHGAYITPEKLWEFYSSPENLAAVFNDLYNEQCARRELEAKVERDAPKVLFAEQVESSEDTISIKEMAGLFHKNGMDMGQNRLYQRLRDDNLLCTRNGAYNLPTQMALEQGWFKIREKCYDYGDERHITSETRVTVKGQKYLLNRYLNRIIDN